MHVVEGVGHRQGARHRRAVGAFGEHVAAGLDVGTAQLEQRRELDAGELGARQHAVRVLHAGHRRVGPLHRRIGAALDEVDARDLRQPHQVVHGEDARRAHQAVHHQPVLRGIDVPPALVMALEVQPARRDDAEERLQRAERHRGLRYLRQPRALPALDVVLPLRGRAVAGGGHRLAKALRVLGQLEDGGVAVATGIGACAAAGRPEATPAPAASAPAMKRRRALRACSSAPASSRPSGALRMRPLIGGQPRSASSVASMSRLRTPFSMGQGIVCANARLQAGAFARSGLQSARP